MDKRKSREMIAIAVPAVIESIFTVIITSIDTKMISVLGKKPYPPLLSRLSPSNFFCQYFLHWEQQLLFLSLRRMEKKTKKRQIDFW